VTVDVREFVYGCGISAKQGAFKSSVGLLLIEVWDVPQCSYTGLQITDITSPVALNHCPLKAQKYLFVVS
jgi:hypothetical protein